MYRICPASGRARCERNEEIYGRLLDQRRCPNRRILGGKARSKTMSPQLTAIQHEWLHHGTCYSTLRPSCLPPGSPRGAEAVAYFKRVVGLFKQLPTYQWLDASGIVPNERAYYDFDDIINALKATSGVRCARWSSTFALIGSVHSLLRPLNARTTRSTRSAGISTSRGHSSMAN